MKLTIHTDGGSRGNPGPAAAGVTIYRSDDAGKKPLHEAGYFLGRATNNVAEYRGLLRAVEVAVQLKASEVEILSDSELMVRQITGEYRVKSPDLMPLRDEAQRMLLKIDSWTLRHVAREKNARADELANMALDAGRDVVVRSALAGPASTGHVATTDGGSHATQAPHAATVQADPKRHAPGVTKPRGEWVCVARLQRSGGGKSCVHGCAPGQDFTLGPMMPDGLCVYAAKAALDAAIDEQAQPLAPGHTLTNKCPRCGIGVEVDCR